MTKLFHVINPDGSHYIRNNNMEQISPTVPYKEIAKVKVNNIWYLGFTAYFYEMECLSNTDRVIYLV